MQAYVSEVCHLCWRYCIQANMREMSLQVASAGNQAGARVQAYVSKVCLEHELATTDSTTKSSKLVSLCNCEQQDRDNTVRLRDRIEERHDIAATEKLQVLDLLLHGG